MANHVSRYPAPTVKKSREEKLADYDANNPIADLRLLKKVETLMDELLTICERYPRAQRYALALDTRTVCMNLYRLLVEAAKGYYKKTTLTKADEELYLLKRLIRIAVYRHYISEGQYCDLIVRYLYDISYMLGGWIRDEKENKKYDKK